MPSAELLAAAAKLTEAEAELRVIGPEMPSAELLAAAAKLTEAEAELREAEVVDDDEVFIGPPPPAVVTEAESANEAECFEEVTRIMGVEIESPYDVLGVNRNMSADNMKKRYWKLSLMVHPDKCSHPQANQAFVKLNKAFKDFQDPDKMSRSRPPSKALVPSSSKPNQLFVPPPSDKSKSKTVATQPAPSKSKSKSKAKAKPISPPAQPKVKSKAKSKPSRDELFQLARQLVDQAQAKSTSSDSAEEGSTSVHSSEESTNQCSGPEFQDAQDPFS